MPNLQATLARLSLAALLSCPLLAGMAHAAPKIGHVFIIVLENEGYDLTFGPRSPALYLNALARKGALLEKYYGVGHFSLDNYIAMVSGQAPNPVTQADCQSYVDFVSTGLGAYGQALGQGCVYPQDVKTIADQIEGKRNGLTWKAYMEDMGNDANRERASCGHPPIGAKDNTQKAAAGDQYATRHNPFMYFHSVIDDTARCDAHVVNLSALAEDLQNEKTTANYVFITPNLCHDGHDDPCVNGEPGGLISADQFLMKYVPMILNSPAYKQDGLVIITFDEADIDIDYDKKSGKMTVSKGDVSACCGEMRPPNIKPVSRVVFGPDDYLPDKGAGIAGPGGGKIGAVLLSRQIKSGSRSNLEYNHYSMLRSIEEFFDLDYLGYAAQKNLNTFAKDNFWKP